MFPRGGGPGRSAYFESVQRYVPILLGVLFAVIAVAVVRNIVDKHRNPGRENFDAVKNFPRTSARGMAAVVAGRADENQ